ncbi:hypothetical protein TNCV_1746671 [Trichonephila clavipes]|nr:hypothetical protein TNCV_1746671 [Trichonephila clavipes]
MYPSIISPLRNLIKDKIESQWLIQHENAFDKLKESLSSSTVLKVFSSLREAVIQCDSSKDGFVVYLIQNGHPVLYTSRSLTETEQKDRQRKKCL